MSALPLAARRNLTPADLEREGFTREQIARFEWLRAVYPFIEYFGSSHEAKRMQFLKWLHEQGRLAT
jgi:hypothetical protein